MEYRIDDAVEVLTKTPAVLDALVRGKSPQWLEHRIRPGTFSVLDVLGHLILGEKTDWIPRARIILEQGESRTFETFDRYGFDAIIAGKSADALLDEFARLRAGTVADLFALKLDSAKLARTGMHPQLGRVTLANHLSCWVAHDLGHIAQITRIMANRYKDAAGPWVPVMSILQS